MAIRRMESGLMPELEELVFDGISVLGIIGALTLDTEAANVTGGHRLVLSRDD